MTNIWLAANEDKHQAIMAKIYHRRRLAMVKIIEEDIEEKW